MSSSTKGKPTDQKLHDKITDEVMNETNKDGSGKGQPAAWKSAKIAKEYEKQGGGYENEAGSKNEPEKGEPKHKSEAKKEKEEAAASAEKKSKTAAGGAAKKGGAAEKKSAEKKEEKKSEPAKPKAAPKEKKEKKEPTPGTRKSERVSKREADSEKGTTNGKKQKK